MDQDSRPLTYTYDIYPRTAAFSIAVEAATLAYVMDKIDPDAQWLGAHHKDYDVTATGEEGERHFDAKRGFFEEGQLDSGSHPAWLLGFCGRAQGPQCPNHVEAYVLGVPWTSQSISVMENGTVEFGPVQVTLYLLPRDVVNGCVPRWSARYGRPRKGLNRYLTADVAEKYRVLGDMPSKHGC